MKIVAYTYYNNPWKMEAGDDVRIHSILSALARRYRILVFNLSSTVEKPTLTFHNNLAYISLPRRFYKLISKLTGWRQHYDLNPLMKLTHYIDELLTVLTLRYIVKNVDLLVVFGSMSLFSFMTRLVKNKKVIIVYDPLANYAQTLYLNSRRGLLKLPRYGLYLALHKLEIGASDIVVYPSQVDLENARKMFGLRSTTIIPNPPPICYESIEEYSRLRAMRKDFDKPYFILIAGGRGKSNEEAVKMTIEIFNELPPDKFRLFITGPWQDMKKLVRNPSIYLVGIVSKERLKELLAVSDYGLSPIFSHAAGTFLKVLAYIASGLNIIASPQSLQGIDLAIHNRAVFVIKNVDEYKRAAERALKTSSRIKVTNIITCNERINLLERHIKELVERLKKCQ